MSNNSSVLQFYTQNTIQNDAERVTWAVWLFLMFVVSLFGDTTILIASIKYRAFKLNPVIVVFIEHIAVCDLLISFVSILTQSVSLMADGWVFGRHLCYAKVYLYFHENNASLLLLCGMTLSKLLMLKYPLKAQFWKRKHAQFLCTGIWILAATVPVAFLIIDKDDISFNRIKYSCSYMISSPIWKLLTPIFSGLLTVIPITMVIITSILLVKHLLHARKVAQRTNSKVPWQGIVTVVLTATVYCISFFPKGLHVIVVKYEMSTSYQYTAPKVVDTLMYFNVVANFLVYSFTVTSFRKFLKKKMGLGAGELTSSSNNSKIDPGWWIYAAIYLNFPFQYTTGFQCIF